ncbi:hypothetical protein KTD31_03045 [Burkholderia multivorans]|uniref:hypothetical protein n=1 Tax=Burkholderia multivorans TaxID=87883 RepID=UPI001C247C5F|nr:hypothetical protein [Burkholderia multivorans]MBU9200329.1 hypothetical protein [Burkholderia multivorans]MDN8078545.1 hypothetical protein [Burkholderia multivorans]
MSGYQYPVAKRFEILRGIKAGSKVPLAEKPVRVATLIDEAKFEALGHRMVHHQTVFFEDQYHDWTWTNGVFTYYTRVAEEADVLVVYEQEKQ